MSYMAEKLLGAAILAIDVPMVYITIDLASKGHYVQAAITGAFTTFVCAFGIGLIDAAFEQEKRFERFR